MLLTGSVRAAKVWGTQNLCGQLVVPTQNQLQMFQTVSASITIE
jgi:hypothetical protein